MTASYYSDGPFKINSLYYKPETGPKPTLPVNAVST